MILRILLTFTIVCCSSAFANSKSLDTAIREELSKYSGTCVFIDCSSGEIIISDSIMASTRYAPCSTFKIWNTLIGVENHLIQSADEKFYTWDSIPRFLPAWNKDLTLKEAFGVSCVPAFQNLARKIGIESMHQWLDSINYGDKDISSGIDNFWLPADGRKTILISPVEQAQMIRKLINGSLSFSEHSRKILKDVMILTTSSNGVLYGKTGSGVYLHDNKKQSIGWFIGYVIHNDKTYSFSCLIKGDNVSGKDSKVIIETILKRSTLL